MVARPRRRSKNHWSVLFNLHTLCVEILVGSFDGSAFSIGKTKRVGIAFSDRIDDSPCLVGDAESDGAH